ncbi:MAG: leucyl/phenylalanyl-tRNA--protein transferase [Alphaproteobacteria bacterium]|nr:leucyl/phenylalanyl-tRNA--protein transferase [Alphaproteobacteria bacterium]
MTIVVTPELVLEAYAQGIFPMAETAGRSPVYWLSPTQRGQLPIADLHIPRRLRRTVRKFPFDVSADQDFEAVLSACAEQTNNRPETWINDTIRGVFLRFHAMGCAHSVECRREGRLVGGLYGLAIGSAFFGESMFSRETDASKVALVHLAARLWKGGFSLLDTQWVNDHLLQFGCYEIPRDEYLLRLHRAIDGKADFWVGGSDERELIAEYFSFRGFR